MLVLLELIGTLLKILFHCVVSILETIFPFLLPKKDISGQIILVTGAAQGIGQLMAFKVAALGAEVVCWDIQEEPNEETATSICKGGGKAKAYKVDLANSEEIESVAKRVLKDFGRVDILINNAGIVMGKTLVDTPAKAIEKVMSINADAVMTTTRCFLPSMIDHDSGHVVTIASAAGIFGVRKLVDYCASKFAAVGAMESLASELHGAGINVKTTCICPYFIATGMFSGCGGRFPWLVSTLDPESIADKVVDSMLKNQEFLLTPRMLWPLYVLHAFLPGKALRALYDFVGFTQCMDGHQGHQKAWTKD